MEMKSSKLHQEINEIELALGRATLYSALALGFRAPCEDAIARFVGEDNAMTLTSAADLLDPEHEAKLGSSIAALSETAKAGIESLSSSHRALFGHTARGPVPPYQTEYGNEALFQQPQELGDLMGFYTAFGLAVKSGEHERPDHISCESEFLAFLGLKEAYALEHNDAEMLEETRKAQKLFLRDHLGQFVSAFAQELSRQDRGGFYGNLAELCVRFVALESARFNISLGATNIGLRPADDDRVPMACGSGTECAAMPGACSPEEADSV